MEKPNYKNKKRKITALVDKKRFVLSILLVVSLGSNAITIAKGYVEKISEYHRYNQELKPYEQTVNESEYRTKDLQNYFINTKELSEKIKQLEIKSSEDFYHHLIATMNFIGGDKQLNFYNLLEDLNLEELSKTNPNIPSNISVVNSFLLEHQFYNNDGNIDFDKWTDYDRDLFTLENELEELKGGK